MFDHKVWLAHATHTVPVVTRMGRIVTDGGLALLGVVEDGRGTEGVTGNS